MGTLLGSIPVSSLPTLWTTQDSTARTWGLDLPAEAGRSLLQGKPATSRLSRCITGGPHCHRTQSNLREGTHTRTSPHISTRHSGLWLPCWAPEWGRKHTQSHQTQPPSQAGHYTSEPEQFHGWPGWVAPKPSCHGSAPLPPTPSEVSKVPTAPFEAARPRATPCWIFPPAAPARQGWRGTETSSLPTVLP